MAKPIFVVQLPSYSLSKENLQMAMNSLQTKLGEEYHVVVVPSTVTDITFECYNDNRGAKDEDIKSYIEVLNNSIKQHYGKA